MQPDKDDALGATATADLVSMSYDGQWRRAHAPPAPSPTKPPPPPHVQPPMIRAIPVRANFPKSRPAGRGGRVARSRDPKAARRCLPDGPRRKRKSEEPEAG
ncbi:hypothetical protein Zmor_028100 [Zophobas morio]|uniref:Uncharacterized protein n=1 Tax=Zophobas morio TaxID=2755281 RepID=A0AA38M2M3_9CUCU|nr:hypothetical protein Zmor_028100 [Zophobas morio]